MEFSFILLLINIHLIFDFIFQNKRTLEMRFPQKYDKENIKILINGNLNHTLTHFFGSIIFVGIFCYISGQVFPLLQIIAIALIHFIIDVVKSILIIKKICLQEDIWLFLIDQILHIISIFVICTKADLTYLKSLSNYFLTNTDKLLLISIIIISSTFVAGIFIKTLMKFLESRPYRNLIKKNVYIPGEKASLSGAQNGGFIIGVLERTFILIIMAINQPSMIGFVLTAKSVARFKKLEDEGFAEYFIIGSFMSFIIAILGGLLISKLLKGIN